VCSRTGATLMRAVLPKPVLFPALLAVGILHMSIGDSLGQVASPRAQSGAVSPSRVELEEAREFIERFLSAENRKRLTEIAKARGQTMEEAFLSLPEAERITLGPTPQARQLKCNDLLRQLTICSQKSSACDCSGIICESRSATLGCDVAPKCQVQC
jgi:hypothetical protein